jgi:hypothetical protein
LQNVNVMRNFCVYIVAILKSRPNIIIIGKISNIGICAL